MNFFAKSSALRCTLKVLIIFSIEACSLSQSSRYARRYARALRANLREVEEEQRHRHNKNFDAIWTI